MRLTGIVSVAAIPPFAYDGRLLGRPAIRPNLTPYTVSTHHLAQELLHLTAAAAAVASAAAAAAAAAASSSSIYHPSPTTSHLCAACLAGEITRDADAPFCMAHVLPLFTLVCVLYAARGR